MGEATVQMASPVPGGQRLPRDCAVPGLAPRVLAGEAGVAARLELALPAPRTGCPVDAAVARGLAAAVFTAAEAVATFLDVALDAFVAAIGLPGVFEDRVVLPTLDLDAAAEGTADAPEARLSDAALLAKAGVREVDFLVCIACDCAAARVEDAVLAFLFCLFAVATAGVR